MRARWGIGGYIALSKRRPDKPSSHSEERLKFICHEGHMATPTKKYAASYVA
jgi:hypothetical protein